MDSTSSSTVPQHVVADQVRAALRMFHSRRVHECPGCGRLLAQRDEVVRVIDLVYHRSCAPPRVRT